MNSPTLPVLSVNCEVTQSGKSAIVIGPGSQWDKSSLAPSLASPSKSPTLRLSLRQICETTSRFSSCCVGTRLKSDW